MPPFRSARLLLVSTVLVPLVILPLVWPNAAYARGGRKSSCTGVFGTTTTWNLEGCGPPTSTGGSQSLSITPSFPTTVGAGSATITWQGLPNPRIIGQTTFDFNATSPRNRCGTGSSEWVLTGKVTGNSFTPGVLVGSKVKIIVCVSSGGTVTNTVGRAAKIVKL